ncbi:MAG: hypothetical protein OXR72_07425 [Gemmatimonadota bacterium]|nr:hypothetical protein [Gemmatimonadota bacterium]
MPDKESENGEKVVAKVLRKYHDKPSRHLAKFIVVLVYGAIFLIFALIFWALMEWAIH